MKGLIEYKSFTGEIKDLDTTKRVVTGYLSSFGNKDHHGDIIEYGAFKKSIAERKNEIYFLNQHNWAQPHGKFKVLIEDSKGLYFESEPLPNTTYSSDLLKLYEAGIVKEHSIGFNTVQSEWTKDGMTRTIKEVKLYEGSNITLGANPDTPFTGFKNIDAKVMNDDIKSILRVLKTGTLTDDTFILLEIALKKLQLDAYNLAKKTLKEIEPSNDTPLIVEPLEQINIINNFIKTLK